MAENPYQAELGPASPGDPLKALLLGGGAFVALMLLLACSGLLWFAYAFFTTDAVARSDPPRELTWARSGPPVFLILSGLALAAMGWIFVWFVAERRDRERSQRRLITRNPQSPFERPPPLA